MTAPVVLVVLDGFGVGSGRSGDATAEARTPFFERVRATYPVSELDASGEAVGLPEGQMGNSEVGHVTMGAGRVIDQDLLRIGKAIRAGALESNPALKRLFDAVRKSGGRLHLMGLVSDGGVHSHQDHLIGLLEHAGRQGVEPVLHAFLDGRDTPPRSALGFLEKVLPHVEAAGGRVASVSGRYFAMDRDNRWERTQRAYDAIVLHEGLEAADALEAVRSAYARDESDEFVQPTVIAGGPRLADGDAVVFFNFRADRARQLTAALTNACAERFEGKLDRREAPKLAGLVTFNEYDKEFGLPVAFPPEAPRRILGEIVSEAGLRQLRLAETEKYAHVTYFFNCGREQPFPDEDRVLVPSPREVPTYDHKPEMSAREVTQRLLERLDSGAYRFVLVNYANPDMVGHTGVLPATVKAVETIDACLDRVAEKVLELGGTLLVTADHGNCEQMLDPETGQPHTAHTTNPVPLHWIAPDAPGRPLRDGGLRDVAPTVLALLGLDAPAEMTGHSLIG